MMDCVNCGHENPQKALICYWCGLDPATGKHPYRALATPITGLESPWAMLEMEAQVPPAIEIPPPMPVPDVEVGMAALESLDLTMPEPPPIEIAPPPDIPDQAEFTIVRRRVRHRPIIRASSAPPTVTRPVLPGWGRVVVFFSGVILLFVLGSALVAAAGAASFGAAFCLAGLLALTAVLWVGLLLARAGKRAVTRTGAVFERLEVLSKTLREVAPGVVQELPANLPAKTGVLDLPVAYSELRTLIGAEGQAARERAVDLLVGAIASLVGRDEVILARRTYPIETRGALTRATSTEVSRPILTRRRAYVGPGELEKKIAQTLNTDQPMTVEELVQTLVGPNTRQAAERLVGWVDQAVTENPPDLEALTSPETALAEIERFRQAVQRADPELYQLLEEEIRRGLGATVQRSVPSSVLDLAQYVSTSGDRPRRPQRRSVSRREE